MWAQRWKSPTGMAPWFENLEKAVFSVILSVHGLFLSDGCTIWDMFVPTSACSEKQHCALAHAYVTDKCRDPSP